MRNTANIIHANVRYARNQAVSLRSSAAVVVYLFGLSSVGKDVGNEVGRSDGAVVTVGTGVTVGDGVGIGVGSEDG